MKSNYKRLGDYIQESKVRNAEEKAERLLGINIDKFFMPSVANVEGTDLSVYKLVKRNQFACNRMHVGRDYRLPIAMSKSDEEFMVSPAYDVFEIKYTEVLDPEFLMMWFARKEFDRNAWFYTDADVRGGLPWKSFCDMQLPVPKIDKQREIVKKYNTIQNRIDLNQQLVQKLEETARAIYREWFVEFEFPDENGKPYKSNGGDMIWNEELGKEIPKGWKIVCLESVIKYFISKRGKSKSKMNLQQQSYQFKYPVISAKNISSGKIVRYDTIPYVNKQEYDEWMDPKLEVDDVLLTSEAPLGETFYIATNSDYALSQRLFALRTKKEKISGWSLYLWLNSPTAKQDLEGRSSGTTVFGIKLSELKKINILLPDKTAEHHFNQKTNGLPQLIEIKNQENQKLTDMKDLLLSKMTTIENKQHE